MAEPVLLFSVDRGIATLVLNNVARRNSMSREMGALFDDALVAAARDRRVRAMIITGAGSAFCSGGDLDRIADYANPDALAGERDPNSPSDFFDVLPDTPPELRTRYTFPLALPFPVIAAINGAAVGAGLVLALHADIRIASTNAVFMTGFARIGATPEMGMNWSLPQLVGAGIAREMMLTGRRMQAEEALQRGLVSRICEPDALISEAQRLARDLADGVAPRSVRVIKRQLWRSPAQTFADAFFESVADARETFQSAEFREGIAALKERRAPNFGHSDE